MSNRPRTIPSPATLLLALLAIWAGASPSAAQQRTDPDSVAPASVPDLLIRARIKAREIRVHSRAEVRVRLWGCPLDDSLYVARREGLPGALEPGVTYRDVALDATLAVFLTDSTALTEITCGPAPARGDSTGPAPRRLPSPGSEGAARSRTPVFDSSIPDQRRHDHS